VRSGKGKPIGTGRETNHNRLQTGRLTWKDDRGESNRGALENIDSYAALNERGRPKRKKRLALTDTTHPTKKVLNFSHLPKRTAQRWLKGDVSAAVREKRTPLGQPGETNIAEEKRNRKY